MADKKGSLGGADRLQLPSLADGLFQARLQELRTGSTSGCCENRDSCNLLSRCQELNLGHYIHFT